MSARIAPGNQATSDAWDGAEGQHWAAHAERYERGAAAYRDRLLAAAALTAGERVLDVGCGNGGTSVRAGAAVGASGRVLGVDLSGAMLAVARDRAAREGLDHVTFEQADAQVHAFPPAGFDVVLSSFGGMFFADPVAAYGNIAAAVVPGGRLLTLVWQDLAHNEWVACMRSALAAGRQLPQPPPGAPGPLSWGDPATGRHILEAAGWMAVEHESVVGDFNVGPDPDDAFAFIGGMGFTRSLLADLDAPTRQRAADDLRAVLAEHQTRAGVVFGSAAWLVTARRT